MSLFSYLRAPRAGFLVLLAVALGWWAWVSHVVGNQLLTVSKIEFRSNPPGMAPGPEPGRPPGILASNAWDGYIWIHHARDMAERGEWRLKHTDFDHAPEGRGVHWNSGWAWWLIGLGWLDHQLTGVPLENGITRMATWANPIVFGLCLAGVAWLTVARWGAGAAAFLVLAALALPGFQEGFAAGYPDHHGLHNAAIVLCVLGLLLGGLGWVRISGAGVDASASRLPESGVARRCFVLSGVAGACGLWVSALTLAWTLVGVGAGALAAFLFAGRRGDEPGVECKPELWRLWGLVGGGASLALYLLEYFPSRLGMRLEVNHPLYALAWAGGGELLCRVQRWRLGAPGAWRARDCVCVGVALLAVGGLPLAITLGGADWYQPFDAFLFNLHKQIAEFQPLWLRAKHTPPLATGLYSLAMVVVAGLALSFVVFGRGRPVWFRGAAVFGVVAGGAATCVYLYQVRWGMAASSVWLATAPVAGLAWGAVVRANRGWVTRCAMGGAVVAMMAYPAFATWTASRVRGASSLQMERGHGFSLLFRDMAQFIRVTVGPEARVVILSSPNTSNPTSYFGRFHAIGTLYWENRDGLAEAARLFNMTDDEALLRELRARGVTHIIFLNEENFLAQYYELQNPRGGMDGWRQTFGYRAFFEGKLPVWARPLPYAPPTMLKALNPDVRLLQVVPEQSVPEAYVRIGEYYLVNGNLDGALEAMRAALVAAPDFLHARFKLGEILLRAGKIEEAARELRAVLPLISGADRARLCFELAGLATQQGALGFAAELLREVVRLEPGSLNAANNLAWILATAREDSVRNGREAVALAGWTVEHAPAEALFYGTLGAALAEVGDFDSAIKATRRAEQLALETKRPEIASAARARLEAFAAGKRWRE